MNNKSSETSIARGGFFAIDRRIVPVLIDIGMNAAVSYLILARGTGGDNRSTAWSINAIEQHTGISRAGAKAAIDALIGRGLIRQTKAGSRPKYLVLPAHEVAGAVAAPPASRPSEDEDPLLRHVGATWTEVSTYLSKRLLPLAAKGLVEHQPPRSFRRARFDAETVKPDWTWLPNSLIDSAAGEVAPIELLRQSHNLPALRLLILCYHAHDLAGYGGLHWRSVRRTYEGTRIRLKGEWTIWRFSPETKTAWPNRLPASAFMTGKAEGEAGKLTDTGWPSFWAALDLLEQLGLISTVAHLIEADSDDGAVIHPCPDGGEAGEEVEHAITAAAREAALALCGVSPTSDLAYSDGLLIPVRAHIEHAAVAGLYRLRYRPKTGATAAWLGQAGEWTEWRDTYLDIVDRLSPDALKRRA